MRRSLPAALIVALLALAAPALAATIEITNAGPVDAPSCPENPCVVISRTTAVQVKDGNHNGPFVIRADGRIVAWSVTLGLPSSGQIHYFDTNEGGTSRAALEVLRPVGGLSYKLIAESPLVRLQPDFGKTATFTLSASIPVIKDDVVALAVPTWLPALALQYPLTTSWRASRSAAGCKNVTLQTMQSTLGSTASYGCLYQSAMVTYRASEISHG